MTVKVNIHPNLQTYTDDQSVVEVNGRTVGECLDTVISRFPRIKANLMNKNGKLLDHVSVYVNLESAFPEELAKPVKDGDELHIILMVAGG